MLVSLSDFKSYYGITSSDNDTFLSAQLALISDIVEAYCGRKFSLATYEQTFYVDDYSIFDESKGLFLYHYPVVEVVSAELDSGVDFIEEGTLRLHKPSGLIRNKEGLFQGSETLVVTYQAGVSSIPTIIKEVILSIVKERYNKKISGIDLNFGSDVQSVSITGVMSIAYDYTLQSNDRKTRYGNILQNWVNVLDPMRSERVVVGSGKVEYVA